MHWCRDVPLGHKRGGAGATGQPHAPGKGRGQQEIAVPQRVLQQAVQQGSAHDHATSAGRRDGITALAPHQAQPGSQAQQDQGCGRGQAEFHGPLQNQIVGVVKEGHWAGGEGREGPGQIEFAIAHAAPRVLLDQCQHIGPDLEARTGDVALVVQARFSREVHVLVQVGQHPHASPEHAVNEWCANQGGAHAFG